MRTLIQLLRVQTEKKRKQKPNPDRRRYETTSISGIRDRGERKQYQWRRVSLGTAGPQRRRRLGYCLLIDGELQIHTDIARIWVASIPSGRLNWFTYLLQIIINLNNPLVASSWLTLCWGPLSWAFKWNWIWWGVDPSMYATLCIQHNLGYLISK